MHIQITITDKDSGNFRILNFDDSEPDDVCSTIRKALEAWPFGAMSPELTDVTLRTWSEGGIVSATKIDMNH